MTKRLDFDDFKRSTVLAEQAASTLDTVISNVGSGLWGRPSSERIVDELAELPDYRRYLEQRFGLQGKVSSIALVDWSALRDSCRLLEGESDGAIDPFVALANLATVLGAVIFHDRVVLVDAADVARRANNALGLDDVIRGIDLADQGPGHRLRLVLDEHYSWAWHEFNRASTGEVAWLRYLKDAWQQLLPGTAFPDHTSHDIERVLGYNTSPMRKSHNEILFSIDKGSWGLSDRTDSLILDNDVRALVYERFAQSLDTALSDAPGRPSVVYAGGCLRAPLMLARAQYADECLKETSQPEAFLQREWMKHWSDDRREVQLPFWMSAVVASARSVDEVAERVRTLRASTKGVRRRRGELCESLRRGEPSANDALLSALAADLKALTPAWENVTGAAVAAGTTAVQAVAPGIPPEIVTPALTGATVMGDSWLRKLALRLFRPRVYAVYRMGADARELTDILGTSSRLFDFEQAHATQPVGFMRRLGKVAWVN